MDLNQCHEAASKNIASKQIFDRSLMPDRPISEQDLIRMSTAPQLGQDATATPVQTTNDLTRRPEHRDSQIQLSHVNGIRPTQHRANATNSSTSANKSSSSTITKNETVDRISVQPSDTPHNFVPNFQFFNGGSNSSDNSQSNTGELPNLSILNVANGTNGQRECVSRNVPHISQITNQSQSTSISVISTDEEENSTGNVPHLSEIMEQPNNLTDCSTSANSSVPTSHNFVPNFQFFKGGSDYSEDSHSNTGDIPNLSIFNVADGTASGQPECAARNVPYFSQITDRSQSTSGSAMSRVYSNDEGENSTGNVPHLSELMEQLNNQTNCSASAINPMDRISSVPTLTSLPNFSQLLNQSQSLDNRVKKQNSTDHHESPNGNIPHFSQLLSQSHPNI
ncbi:uncharacterized protein LOC119066674 isoform X1 [Bradysia coprophila]|uniref:uncharacterized protein LOC119066674 isoform X1 n=1 Tax=Bradysia coprophila TaxID=38358 RepID=UPI00187D9536|nr:uncharacterized protein LOC119066674 isoform X1 [Bradysia coprophila]